MTKTAGICIIMSVSVTKMSIVKGSASHNFFKAQIHRCSVAGLVGYIQPIVHIGFANMPALIDGPLFERTRWTSI